MSGFEVHVNVTKDNIPNVIRAIETHADNCTRKIAEGIQRKAQAKAPVRTGHLREGIKVNGGGNSYEVSASSLEGGADREYAAYNEYGTRRMGAQPFMRPAFEEAMGSDVPGAFAEYVAAIEGAAA